MKLPNNPIGNNVEVRFMFGLEEWFPTDKERALSVANEILSYESFKSNFQFKNKGNTYATNIVKYSFEELKKDLEKLIDICFDLREAMFVLDEFHSPKQILSYGALLNKENEPHIVIHILNILHIKYRIKDRVLLILENRRLDKKIFQESLLKTLNLFKEDAWKRKAEKELKNILQNKNVSLSKFKKLESGTLLNKKRIKYFKDGTMVGK